MSTGAKTLDRRRNAFREDLAASRLEGRVKAQRFVDGRPAQVAVPAVPLRSAPRTDAGIDTEALFGETLTVYERHEGWAWIQLDRDAYVGYVPESALVDMITEPTHRVSALGTFVYSAADIKSPPLMHVGLNAMLTVDAGDERLSELTTGGFIATRHIAQHDRYARDFVDIAERFIGTPYLWGGRTRLGIDCSGLVQLALEAAGIASPRDSDMQADELGTPVAIPQDLEGLERGDLICWQGHIGIMVDAIMMVHANAHHMAVAIEPLPDAAQRIARTGEPIKAIKRLAQQTATG